MRARRAIDVTGVEIASRFSLKPNALAHRLIRQKQVSPRQLRAALILYRAIFNSPAGIP